MFVNPFDNRPRRYSDDDPRRRADHGVILIALLWILTAIAVIALSFSRESFVEVSAARNARDLADSYFIARAGISATVYKLMERRYLPRVRQLQLEAPPEPIDLGMISGQFGDGVYDVEIQDESGKLNLNFVREEQLRLIIAAAGIDKREGDVIVDSILDWRDADKLHRINGAEDDYYMSLPNPYKSKNGRFDTVEELLLVRGVTRDYFYGHPEKMPGRHGGVPVRPVALLHRICAAEPADQRQLRALRGAHVHSGHAAAGGPEHHRAPQGETVRHRRGDHQGPPRHPASVGR